MNKGLQRFFTPTVIVQIIGWIILIVFFAAGMNSHIRSSDIHMSYPEKIKAFITRPEFELVEKQRTKELESIRIMLQSINDFLRNNK